MALIENYLNMLGRPIWFLIVFFGFNGFSLVSIAVGKLWGPNQVLAGINFYLPIIMALLLSILVFYSNSFILTYVFYCVVWFFSAVLNFWAIKLCLADPTAIGATMFTGIFGAAILNFVWIAKLGHLFYLKFLSSFFSN